MRSRNELATLAGGCFWCTEAIFKRLKGVSEVISGYTGGEMENPTYDHVSTGATGHAETVQITFDPDIISFEKILEIFFATHDPTTKDRQGQDNGPQYRSAIFYHDEDQKRIAKQTIAHLSEKHKDPIVTEVTPLTHFYPAEHHHQNYYEKNPDEPYCQLVITPKIEKLEAKYKHLLSK